MSACKGYVKPSYFKLLLSFIIHQIILFVCDWCKHVMWLILGNIKHLMTGPEGNSEFCFPRMSMFPNTKSRETLRFEGNKIHRSPRDQSLSDLLYSKTKQKQNLKTALRFQRSRATAVNISRVTVNCFPFDVIVFAMLPAHLAGNSFIVRCHVTMN